MESMFKFRYIPIEFTHTNRILNLYNIKTLLIIAKYFVCVNYKNIFVICFCYIFHVQNTNYDEKSIYSYYRLQTADQHITITKAIIASNFLESVTQTIALQ